MPSEEEATMKRPRRRPAEALLAEMAATEVPANALAIWYIGQEGFAFKGDGMIVYTDPYLSNYVHDQGFPPEGWWDRLYDSPIPVDGLTNADLVLLTHHHGDHIDPASIGQIARSSPSARFVVPAPHVEYTAGLGVPRERMIPARAEQEIRVGNATVLPIATPHETFETDANGDHLYLSYVLRLNGVTLYHAGDNIGYPELAEKLRPLGIDICMCPINGRSWWRTARGILGNMDYREAVELGTGIGADLLIPMHYDMFVQNGVNPSYFVDYLFRTYPDQASKLFVPGERMLYLKRRS